MADEKKNPSILIIGGGLSDRQKLLSLGMLPELMFQDKELCIELVPTNDPEMPFMVDAQPPSGVGILLVNGHAAGAFRNVGVAKVFARSMELMRALGELHDSVTAFVGAREADPDTRAAMTQLLGQKLLRARELLQRTMKDSDAIQADPKPRPVEH